MARPRRSAAPVTSAVAEFCGSTMMRVCCGLDYLPVVRGRLYFWGCVWRTDQFNCPASKLHRKGTTRGALFCTEADVIPFRHGRKRERRKRRARCYRDCGGARHLHPVHALLLRPSGSRPYQSLRLALPNGAAARPLPEQSRYPPPRSWRGHRLFIDRADRATFEQLTLLDINRHCLARSAQRLARYHPLLCEANLFAPVAIELEPVDSVGLTYVLHCLLGRMAEKLKAIDHLRPLMNERAVLFGA